MNKNGHIGVNPRPPHVSPSAGKSALDAAKQRADPVGVVPMPKIPRLDQHAVLGKTMAEQARPLTPDQAAHNAGIFQQPFQQSGPPAILSTDRLPEAAKKDPMYVNGMGSELAATQPNLAYKYGIVRNGQHLMCTQQPVDAPSAPTTSGPSAPDEPRRGRFRESTLKGVEKIMQEQQKRLEGVDINTAQGEDDRTPPREIATAPADPKEKMSDAEVQELLSSVDTFDLHRVRSEMKSNIFNTPAQRRIIESRLKPLKLQELLQTGTIKQKITVNSELSFVLEHVGGTTDIKVKEIVSRACRALDMGDAYFQDLYMMILLALAVYRINDKVYPEYRDKHGEPDERLIWDRFNAVAANILPLLGVLSVNYVWFDERVRKLFLAEEIKNG